MTRWLLRAAVTLVVAVVLLRVVPLSTLAPTLRRVSLPVWIASLVVFVTGHYLNALKLRLLLGGDRSLMPACVRAQYAGLVANLGLPGIAGGDVARAAYLAPLAGPGRVVLASLADRILDSVNLLLIAAVALVVAGVPSGLADTVHVNRSALAVLVGLGVVAAAGAVILVMRVKPGARLADAWTAVSSRRTALLPAVAISLGVQSAFVLTNVWMARSVGVNTPLAPWFVAWPLSKLVAVLPISLGGIGVREAALVTLLTPYGAPRDGVLATGVLWQAVLAVSGLGGLVVTHVFAAPARGAAPASAEPR
jgi:uncharacterized membrane protein YbhN (UPF0104 family)